MGWIDADDVVFRISKEIRNGFVFVIFIQFSNVKSLIFGIVRLYSITLQIRNYSMSNIESRLSQTNSTYMWVAI